MTPKQCHQLQLFSCHWTVLNLRPAFPLLRADCRVCEECPNCLSTKWNFFLDSEGPGWLGVWRVMGKYRQYSEGGQARTLSWCPRWPLVLPCSQRWALTDWQQHGTSFLIPGKAKMRINLHRDLFPTSPFRNTARVLALGCTVSLWPSQKSKYVTSVSAGHVQPWLSAGLFICLHPLTVLPPESQN